MPHGDIIALGTLWVAIIGTWATLKALQKPVSPLIASIAVAIGILVTLMVFMTSNKGPAIPPAYVSESIPSPTRVQTPEARQSTSKSVDSREMEHSITEQHLSVHATKSPEYDPKQIPMEPANSRYEMTRADDYEQIPMEPANSRYEMTRADDEERIPMEPANSRYEMTEIQESATVPALSPSPQ